MQSLPMDRESLAVLAEYGLGEARLSGCHLRRYEAGEAMVRQDEDMDALLFVRSGRAKVCINARNGRHLIICYYISDGVLGDVELLTEAQAMDTVTALSQVDCVAVPMERNREVLLGCLPFVLRMGQEVSGKLKYSSHAHTALPCKAGNSPIRSITATVPPCWRCWTDMPACRSSPDIRTATAWRLLRVE